jgi:hypothetical protein
LPHSFKLSAAAFWSADPVTDDAVDGVEMAWSVQFVNGQSTKGLRAEGYASRALCVRSASSSTQEKSKQ